ncbi:ABC transporter ATP-binding protein [uncultured Cohaesibacter sp.]|uniref:ABC transporter ATP-binding protein n=1 Tax=uncultured Cohaesibacter sp. TaxID=1002546 RepID=UPI002931241D|nr:ABC transporter ATP-binding protein [uncultured Cohaesibacter sp.]
MTNLSNTTGTMPKRPEDNGMGVSDNLLSMRNLTVSFKTDDTKLTALNKVSLAIPEGKTLCLVGESGCGKSVTAKAILRVLAENASIDEGEMLFRTKSGAMTDLASIRDRGEAIRKLRGDEIAMIYQEPMTAISPLYSIGNQIVEALRWHRNMSEKEARREALEVLRQVGMPAPERRIDSYSFELSGGQRQRAMIAMALICRPRLLIADEPTTALDVTTQAVILDLLRKMQEQDKMSMLFITHDLGVVAEIADEVAVMYMGNVVERGPVERILTDPVHPYTKGLIASLPTLSKKAGESLKTIPGSVPHLKDRPKGCAFSNRCELFIDGTCNQLPPLEYGIAPDHEAYCHALARCDASPQTDAAITSKLAPRKNEQDSSRKGGPDYNADPILKLRHLSKSFTQSSGFFSKTRHIHSLNGVSFDLWPGETLGLVGESGCGKSTLGQTVLGLHKPTSGAVEVQTEDGYVDLAQLPRKQLKKHWHDIRMVFQDPDGSFNPRLTVFDIIAEVLRMGGQSLTGKDITKRVEDVMQMVGLDKAFLDRYPHAFSGGQRQRIGIARALAPQPRIVIADEPVSALDVSVQAQVLNLLKDLQRELGLVYLFISHDLSVVKHISDRVAVMYAGQIVEIAPADDLFNHPKHPYTRALMAALPEPIPRSMRETKPHHISGSVPDPANLPKGCPFHPRCMFATDKCKIERPEIDATGYQHAVSCFFPQLSPAAAESDIQSHAH